MAVAEAPAAAPPGAVGRERGSGADAAAPCAAAADAAVRSGGEASTSGIAYRQVRPVPMPHVAGPYWRAATRAALWPRQRQPRRAADAPTRRPLPLASRPSTRTSTTCPR
jgi:hypothetical protein